MTEISVRLSVSDPMPAVVIDNAFLQPGQVVRVYFLTASFINFRSLILLTVNAYTC